MKKRKFNTNYIFIILILLIAFLLTSCKNKSNDEPKELEICGGDIVKNNTIMLDNDYLAYELPIISNCKITTFNIIDFFTDGEGKFDIKFKDLTGGERYNGWYYYFANLEINVKKDIKADFSINSASILINNQRIEYKIPDLHFCNALSYFGENCNTDKRDFVYDYEKTVIYQYIPSGTIQTIKIAIDDDCTITDFNMLDYVSVDNLVVKVNGTNQSISDGLKVHKGDSVEFDYTLSYKNGISDINLLKTTFYISYIDKQGKQCAFVDAQGLIIIDYINDNFVKKYIKGL